MTAPHDTSATVRVSLPDAAATRRLGAHLARLVRRGDVVGLGGVLGAGKTTLVRHVIAALAGAECEVPSPTFTLVQIYAFEALTVWHFDLYRVERPEEALELGYEDALAEGVTFVEWPERLGPLLPPDRLEIVLEQGPRRDARLARITAYGVWVARVAELTDAAVARDG